jgi:hypothetical protein
MSKNARNHAELLAGLAGLSAEEIQDILVAIGERMISVPDAARMNKMSADTFKRRHGDKIRKVTEKLRAVKLRDALAVPQPLDAA